METKTIEITVTERSSGFKAFLKAYPGVWESGTHAAVAISKLLTSLGVQDFAEDDAAACQEITVTQRSSDFQAVLTYTRVWETAAAEAIGRWLLSGQLIDLTVHRPPAKVEKE